jgi:hypothetical protein
MKTDTRMRKTLFLFGGLVLIVVGILGFHSIFIAGSPAAVIEGTNEAPVITVDRAVFENGTYTYEGAILVPTSCEEVAVEAVVADARGEKAELRFTTTKKEGAICVEVITAKPFKIVFKASQAAEITATLNGKDARLDVKEFFDRTAPAELKG